MWLEVVVGGWGSGVIWAVEACVCGLWYGGLVSFFPLPGLILCSSTMADPPTHPPTHTPGL